MVELTGSALLRMTFAAWILGAACLAAKGVLAGGILLSEADEMIYGAAFDYQIDRLEKAGYEVEILPDPPVTTERGES